MKIWAIGDLHLSFGIPNKSMELFGPLWREHPKRVEQHWDASIDNEDLVLIPGDISWAMKLEEAIPDLRWIDERPGTKVMIKGNHDHWWSSLSKVRKALPPSIHVIQNDAFIWQGQIAIGGARLWDSDEYHFYNWVEYVERENGINRAHHMQNSSPEDRVIYQRELIRLEESLKKMPHNLYKIAMTHYPPIGPNLNSSAASSLFSKYGVSQVVFGHLHSLKQELKNRPIFGMAQEMQYTLTSCDWIDSKPICIYYKK
ncbi:MAG: metallophosphoesterase [Chlamydia sp.]